MYLQYQKLLYILFWMENINFNFLQYIVIYAVQYRRVFERLDLQSWASWPAILIVSDVSMVLFFHSSITPFASLYSPMRCLKCEISSNSFPRILLKTSSLFGWTPTKVTYSCSSIIQYFCSITNVMENLWINHSFTLIYCLCRPLSIGCNNTPV